MSSDRVVALFAGAGGLSSGFAVAGCKPAVAAEIDPDAAGTYHANLGVECHTLNLENLDSMAQQRLGLDRTAFAVIGGPPCQGFSTAGGRDHTDPRNRLIFSYLDIVSAIRPRWFLFENVEGILTSNKGASIRALVERFIRLGYWVRLDKLNFAAYGLPQARKRVILIGNRLGLDIPVPRPTHSYSSGKHKWISSLPLSPTLIEALAGLGVPARGDTEERIPYASATPISRYDADMRQGNSSGVVSHHFWIATMRELQRLRYLKPGQTMKNLPPELWHDSFGKRASRRVRDGIPTDQRGGAPAGVKRLIGDLNSLTITSATTREFVHPLEDRPLTLREAARLQSFPDYYRFFGKRDKVALQIGNAFPPIVAKVFAKHLLELDGTCGADTMRTNRSSNTPRLLGFTLTSSTGMSPALAAAERLLQELCPACDQDQLNFLAS